MARIAIVDDDTAFLMMLRDMLTAEGWEVDMIPESDGAFAKLKHACPDLILLDIRADRPGFGWELLEGLSEDRATADIPIAVFSAIPEELRSREGWLADHGIGILPKPFNIDDLCRCIRSLLQGRGTGCVGLAPEATPVGQPLSAV